MPLVSGWSKKDYFNAAWQSSFAQSMQRYYNSSILVYTLKESAGVFDPKTGQTTYPEDSIEIHYSGRARVQPRRAVLGRGNNAADTVIRNMQFQIPIPGTVGNEGYRIDEPPKAYRVDGEHSSTSNATVIMVGGQPWAVPLSDGASGGSGDIPLGAVVRVTGCKLFPLLTKFDYRVNATIESANPIERTFEATSDQEVRLG